MPVSEGIVRLVRALPEAAVLVTARGEIVEANAAARAAFALGPAEATASSLFEVAVDREGKLAETLRSWARSVAPLPGSWTLRSETADVVCNCQGCLCVSATEAEPALLFVRFWPRAQANPFLLLNQKVTELNDEVRRRTHIEEALRRSEAQLRERAKEAEELNRTKDEFLATVSHELRTPLNAILGWASVLRRRSSTPEVSKPAEVIERNALRQAQIIDDILDVSRIISGMLRINTRTLDLCAVVAEAMDVVRPSAIAKNIDLSLGVTPETCALMGDPDRLRQVVWNLLSNAVKFTAPGGKILVNIACSAERCVLSVSDTGRGIDPEFLPHVFERFRQADGSSTRREGGLGLGLAIVRHIVELHGGEVEARSPGPGMGATFSIALPVWHLPKTADGELHDIPTSVASDASSTGHSGRLGALRILVVDDEPDARELLSAVLGEAGARPMAVDSVKSALDAVRHFRPDIIVSDLGMPDEDGYSLIRKVKALPALSATPTIAVSAYTRAEDRRKALAAGFVEHVGKPVSPDKLVAAVEGLVPLLPKG